MAPGAIVVGAHVNGLGVVRALAARGAPIAVVSTRPFDVAQHSRWVSETHKLPELHERPESLLELLESGVSRWSGWTVFPTTDDALIVLAQQHELLSRSYRLPVQPWEVVGDLVDKDRMHSLAQRAGLEVPVCHGAATTATAERVTSYPVLVKPLRHDRLISAFGVKLFVAEDEDGLRTAIGRLAGLELPGLLFDFVPGSDSHLRQYCVYIDADGEPSPGVTVQKLRQNPAQTGGACVARVVPEVPELREATVELLRLAGFRGMAFAEFKLNPWTGRHTFVEVNGRAPLFNSILPPTGIDLVGMAWSDFVLDEPLQPRPTGWRGTWIHFQADIRRFVADRHVERLSVADLLASYWGPKAFAVWSRSDPRPFLAETVHGARGAARLLAERRRGSSRLGP
jgi:D-aspartate ligase